MYANLLCVSAFLVLSGAGADYHDEVGIPLATRMREEEHDMRRIIAGERADPAHFPFFAGLLVPTSRGSSLCGSSLVSARAAVTAAHCVVDGARVINQVTLVVGSSSLFTGGTRVVSSSVRVHEGYRRESIENDLAVITVPAGKLTNITPIPLWRSSEDLTGRNAISIGFGRTTEMHSPQNDAGYSLNYVKSAILSVSACARLLPHVRATNVCVRVGTSGVCQGDSGGPLVLDGKLVGVTSFVSGAGCVRGNAAAFTRVSAYLPWIKTHAQV